MYFFPDSIFVFEVKKSATFYASNLEKLLLRSITALSFSTLINLEGALIKFFFKNLVIVDKVPDFGESSDSSQSFHQASSTCHNILRLFGHSMSQQGSKNAGKMWSKIKSWRLKILH